MSYNNGRYKGLCPVALGIGFAVAEGLATFLIGLLATFSARGTTLVHSMGSIYYGFGATIGGSIIGLIWGLVIGFIFGIIVAWVYNGVTCQCTCKRCKVQEVPPVHQESVKPQ